MVGGDNYRPDGGDIAKASYLGAKEEHQNW
jgi:hypothetical protein